MKKFLVFVMEWKSASGLMFTGAAVLYMAALFFLRAQPDLGILFSLLLVSALGSFLQLLAFTDCIIRRLRYSLRLLLFVALFLPVLAACAICFRWFPAGNSLSWAIFLAIFLVIFLVTAAGFELYFYLTGRKYDGILGQYKRNHEQQT